MPRTLASPIFIVMACGFAFTPLAPGFAQSPPSGTLTLQSAVDRALAANPTIVAARLGRAVNVAGLALAAERLNPEVTVEIEKETPKQAIGFAFPLELGGKRAKRIAVSEATIRAGDAELSATIAQVRNDVRRAYFDALVTDSRLAVLRELRELSARTRDTAQMRYEGGDTARLDVLQAQLALASADNETTAAEGGLVAARAKLNAVMGQPLETVQALATPLDPGRPIDVNAALDLARMGNTEVAVLDRQIDAQRARVTLAQASRVPDLMPTASVTHDSQPEFSYGWRAGVALTVPLLTTHRAGVLLEQTTLDQLLARRQAALARITADVTAAVAAAEAQRAAYVRYRDVILPQAQEVEQLAQYSYERGQTGIAALLQALQASRDIRLRSLDVISQFHTAFADLERAIGAPLP